MKALKIRVDWDTGERAGGIDIRRFPYPAIYQDFEGEYEIRLVPDHIADAYKGREGIEVLEGKQILDELEKMIKPSYMITDVYLFMKSIEKRLIGNFVLEALYDRLSVEVPFDDFLEFLYEIGIPHIRKTIQYEDRIKKLLKEMVKKGIITQVDVDEFMKRVRAKKRNHPKVVEALNKLMGKQGVITI